MLVSCLADVALSFDIPPVPGLWKVLTFYCLMRKRGLSEKEYVHQNCQSHSFASTCVLRVTYMLRATFVLRIERLRLNFGSSSSCILSDPDIDFLMSNLFPCLSVICVMDKSGCSFTELLQVCLSLSPSCSFSRYQSS